MNNCVNIGITGPSGAGKSTICDIISKYGYKILDADEIAKDTINSNQECLDKLSKQFGNNTILDGKLNRKYLADCAFKSKEALKALSDITHPYIFERIKNEVLIINGEGNNTVVDAAALLESRLNCLCDYVIAVIAPKDIRVKRIMKRDNLTYIQALNRINAQNDDDFYISKSRYVLNGSKSIILLQEEIKEIILRGLNNKNAATD